MFRWQSEVQDQDLDIQNIVNNAVYLQYFDRARIEYLHTKGLDWEAWHHQGLDFVVIHVDMEIKKSLKRHEKFYVTSTYEKSGRLRIVFHQAIYKLATDQLVAKAKNTLVCVSTVTGKPVMPKKLLFSLFE